VHGLQALRVLTENSSQLVVTQGSTLSGQGLFWMLFPWIVGTLCIWISWRLGKTQITTRTLVVAAIAVVLFSLFFDFAGGARFFIRHTLTLSRDSAQAVSEERWFGKLTDRTVCNMNAIEYAQLEFARSGSKRIIFVMKNDSVIVPLRSSYTDEQGYYAVLNAINRFLGVPGRPAPQSEKDQ